MTKVAEFNDLSVYEWDTGYSVIYREGLPSNLEHWIGDGVDWYFDENLDSLASGSDELHAAIQADLEASYDEWLEAYFPDIQEVGDE